MDKGQSCPCCGALPIDWTSDPFAVTSAEDRKEMARAVLARHLGEKLAKHVREGGPAYISSENAIAAVAEALASHAPAIGGAGESLKPADREEEYRCCGCGTSPDGRHQRCKCPTRLAWRRGTNDTIIVYRDEVVARYVERAGEPKDMDEALTRLAALAATESRV